MASILTIVAVASMALILILSRRRGKNVQMGTIHDWRVLRQAIDVEILHALLDQDDCRYVRESLPPREFRVFQRKRIRLALRILLSVERNAASQMEFVRAANLSDNPKLRQEANDLETGFIQLRLNLLRARYYLYLQWLFPALTPPFVAFATRYQHPLDFLTRFDREEWQEFIQSGFRNRFANVKQQ